MSAFLGCDRYGTVEQQLDRGMLATCALSGRPFREPDLVEARTLGRERRAAEQFRRAVRLDHARRAGAHLNRSGIGSRARQEQGPG